MLRRRKYGDDITDEGFEIHGRVFLYGYSPNGSFPDRFRGPPKPAPRGSLSAAQSPGPSHARAGPLEALADHFVLLTERNVSPRSWDTRGPPGSVPETLVNCRVAGQTRQPKARGVHSYPRDPCARQGTTSLPEAIPGSYRKCPSLRGQRSLRPLSKQVRFAARNFCSW